MKAAPAPEYVERLRAVIAARLGLHFDEARLGSLTDALRDRLAARGIPATEYLDGLECSGADDGEFKRLAEALTVPETYFFRNPEQFAVLSQVALADWAQGRLGQPALRVLSAGCASGEEAYSVAITLRERTTEAVASRVAIRAVDLSPAVIERARRARYSPWSLRETPPDVQARWFRKSGREFVLADEIRAMVSFEEGNLSQDDRSLWPTAGYDVVFCRNVMMYFTPTQAQALVERIDRSLVPGGYLFLGHAETLRGLSQDFHLRHTHGTFYYQRRHESEVAQASQRSRRALSSSSPAELLAGGEGSWIDTIRHASERIEALSRNRTGIRSADVGAQHTPPPDLGHAMELLQHERFAEALTAVQALPTSFAQSPEALLLRAVLLAHNGNLREAEQASLELLRVEELNAGAHYILALCREGLGDAAGAAEYDQIASYLDASFAMPRLHLGLIARRAGNHETARRELGQALVLLQREDESRLLLFGGGFGRTALLALCRAELVSCGGTP